MYDRAATSEFEANLLVISLSRNTHFMKEGLDHK